LRELPMPETIEAVSAVDRVGQQVEKGRLTETFGSGALGGRTAAFCACERGELSGLDRPPSLRLVVAN